MSPVSTSPLPAVAIPEFPTGIRMMVPSGMQTCVGCPFKTMNTCRTAWHDYFDQFLVALHGCLLGQSRANAMLMELVDANAFFWDEYRDEAGWRRYVEKFMLEDYCDADFVPKRLYRGLWHWRRDVSRDDYVCACREYIRTATELIDRRGKRMMREVVRRGGGGSSVV